MSRKVLRQPVMSTGAKAVQTKTVVGIDPGFANTGIAVVRANAKGKLQLVYCRVIVTELPLRKVRQQTRMSTFDLKRMAEIYHGVKQVFDMYHPHAVGVETYAPFKGRLAGNAWKTAFAYALACGLCIEREILCFPNTPQELKRGLTGVGAGGKSVVWEAARRHVGGVQQIDAMAAAAREHVTDALGHAVLAYREVSEWGKHAY